MLLAACALLVACALLAACAVSAFGCNVGHVYSKVSVCFVVLSVILL